MNDLQIVDAVREQQNIRMSLASPTGFGKTYGALLIALGMTGGNARAIGLVDTENGSASLYANLGVFKTIKLGPPYSSKRYIQAIKMFEADPLIEVIILDSVTHVWKGAGGLLEHNDNLGGRFSDWAKTTPLYLEWLDCILQSPKHVICTMRKKQAYALTTGDNGRQKVEKKGMEDQIRDGFDYEMTVAFELINDKHLCCTSKDRTQMFTGQPEFVITPETGKTIKAWCDGGAIPASKPTGPTELLTQTHPAWVNVTDALLNKGYSVAQVKSKYLLAPEVEAVLDAIVLARAPKTSAAPGHQPAAAAGPQPTAAAAQPAAAIPATNGTATKVRPF